MSTHEEVKYHCDKCDKKLSDSTNSLNIVTEISEGTYWERLHVKIINDSGVHNNGTERDADLCKGCAIKLLTDALKRIKAGERATAGTEESTQQGWAR